MLLALLADADLTMSVMTSLINSVASLGELPVCEWNCTIQYLRASIEVCLRSISEKCCLENAGKYSNFMRVDGEADWLVYAHGKTLGCSNWLYSAVQS